MKAEHLDEQPSITNTDDKVLSKLSQHWLKIIEGIADTKGGQEALDNYIEYTTAIKTLLANKIKEAELRGAVNALYQLKADRVAHTLGNHPKDWTPEIDFIDHHIAQLTNQYKGEQDNE